MNFSSNETALTSNQSDKGSPGAHGGTFSGDTGDAFASFLLGSLNGGQISTTNFISSTRKAWAFYAQDDWKITRKITIQLGVRYERLHFGIPHPLDLFGNHAGHAIEQFHILAQIPPATGARSQAKARRAPA